MSPFPFRAVESWRGDPLPLTASMHWCGTRGQQFPRLLIAERHISAQGLYPATSFQPDFPIPRHIPDMPINQQHPIHCGAEFDIRQVDFVVIQFAEHLARFPRPLFSSSPPLAAFRDDVCPYPSSDGADNRA